MKVRFSKGNLELSIAYASVVGGGLDCSSRSRVQSPLAETAEQCCWGLGKCCKYESHPRRIASGTLILTPRLQGCVGGSISNITCATDVATATPVSPYSPETCTACIPSGLAFALIDTGVVCSPSNHSTEKADRHSRVCDQDSLRARSSVPVSLPVVQARASRSGERRRTAPVRARRAGGGAGHGADRRRRLAARELQRPLRRRLRCLDRQHLGDGWFCLIHRRCAR